jgi:hypothetical protein
MCHEEKTREVFSLCRQGLTVKQIGARLDIDPQHIYALAREEGFSVTSSYSAWPKKDDSPIGFTTSPDIWSASPDAIREAIWKRAREAARDRLNAIHQEEVQAAKAIENSREKKLSPLFKNIPVDNGERCGGDQFLRALRRQIA